MRKFPKVISIVIVISMIMSLLVGCASDEISLFDAMNKTAAINSMENSTEVKIHFDASELPEDQIDMISQFADMLNNLKIKVDSKTIRNTEKTDLKQQINVNAGINGMDINVNMWQDFDFTSEEPVMKQIVEIPAFIAMAFPQEFEGKQYLVMDHGELTGTYVDPQIDSGNVMKKSMEMQGKVLDFIKSYAVNFNPGFAVVTRKDNKIVDGESFAVYELKLDDAALKALIGYFVNNTLKDESVLNFVRDIMLSTIELANLTEYEAKEAKNEIEKQLDEFKENLPEYIDMANDALSAFKDVEFLGEDGIKITYTVNKDGYIVEENGYIDLVIDTGAIEDAIRLMKLKQEGKKIYLKRKSESFGIYKIGLEYNSVTSNINKVADFDLPETDSNNSIFLSDLIGIQDSFMFGNDVFNEEYENFEDYEYEELPLTVMVDDQFLVFTVDPYFEGETLMIEARTIFEALGAEVELNGKDKTVVITKDDITVTLKQNSNIAIVNGKEITLDAPVTVVNNKTMVPAGFAAEVMNVGMELNRELNILFFITEGI